MKKAINIVFIILFFGICSAPLAGMLLGFENINAEKRSLAEAPAVFTDKGFNEDFTHEFDDYFTDNFAFRTNLVTLYANLNVALLGESVSDQVIIGKDGWLFFEPTLDDYMKTDTLTRGEIRRLAKTLEIQSRYIMSSGRAFIFTAAPNKASVYGEHMPDRFKALGDKSNVQMLYDALRGSGVDYTDLHEALRAGGEGLYHKLDTHWSNKGALLAYNTLLGKVRQLMPGFTYDTHEELTPALERTWEGDLSGMLYPAAGILDEQYIYDIPKEYSIGRPIKSLEDLTIKTESDKGRLNLLMFRDSFANALIPVMSNEFASVTYSRAMPYDYRLMSGETDIVILEIAERNIPDMLSKAPLMPAPEADINGEPASADMQITIEAEELKDYIKITGIALPPGYSADEDYSFFIRLSNNAKTYTFEPFPILEEEYFIGREQYGNAAFSMIIEKDTLPAGEYDIEVIVSANGRSFADKADKSVKF